jgi:hypothetical protein
VRVFPEGKLVRVKTLQKNLRDLNKVML